LKSVDLGFNVVALVHKCMRQVAVVAYGNSPSPALKDLPDFAFTMTIRASVRDLGCIAIRPY